MTDDAQTRPTRRQLLAGLGLVGAGAVLGLPRTGAARAQELVRRAASTAPAGSDLGAVEHVVFLMMENRSYDNYFGAYPRGRGFDDHPPDRLGVFAQAYPDGNNLSPRNVLLPFHLTKAADEECTRDLTHNWGPMHQCWNDGRMDSWVRVHTSPANEGANGALTMGYYTRQELPYYWALADQFTLGDAYHCSILGPTHPNRVISHSGTIDPAGTRGGPVTDTNPDPRVLWTCTWPTVNELLEDEGVSWKVYHPSNGDLATLGADAATYAPLTAYPVWNPALYDPTTNQEVLLTADNVLPYFKNFRDPTTPLHQKAFGPTFPAGFVNDVKAGTLPSVSWIVPPIGFDDHPSAAPDRGMYFSSLVVDALVANPAVWSKTVLFLMYDENDGFFDHVSPPTAAPGTPGEWLTAKTISQTTLGIRGPLGLGVRVPMLVISPFARGGHTASVVSDHTSQLKFLEQRFGIHVSELSAWRRSTVGDLTDTLFKSAPDNSMPPLPAAPLTPPQASGPCQEALEESEFGGAGPTLPAHQAMPTQDGRLIPAAEFADVESAASRGKTPAAGSRGPAAKAELARTGGQPAKGAALALLAAGAAGLAVRRRLAHDLDEDPTGPA
jgi:phospholipase C